MLDGLRPQSPEAAEAEASSLTPPPPPRPPSSAAPRAAGTLPPPNAKQFRPPQVDRLLASRSLVWGFGHRLYKGGDPRNAVFKALARALAPGSAGGPALLAASERMEAVMEARKRMYPNADFYAASMFRFCGARAPARPRGGPPAPLPCGGARLAGTRPRRAQRTPCRLRRCGAPPPPPPRCRRSSSHRSSSSPAPQAGRRTCMSSGPTTRLSAPRASTSVLGGATCPTRSLTRPAMPLSPSWLQRRHRGKHQCCKQAPATVSASSATARGLCSCSGAGGRGQRRWSMARAGQAATRRAAPLCRGPPRSGSTL